MQTNIIMNEQDITNAMRQYLAENAPVPITGDINIELVPAKGTTGPSAVVSILDDPKDMAAGKPSTKPTTIATKPPVANDDDDGPDNPYEDMGRPEILKLCEERGLPVRSEGASKDKRTTALIKDLVAWDVDQQKPDPGAGTTPTPPTEVAPEAIPSEAAGTPTESQLFDASPPAETQTPATGTGPADHLFTPAAAEQVNDPPVETPIDPPVEDMSGQVESLFG